MDKRNKKLQNKKEKNGRLHSFVVHHWIRFSPLHQGTPSDFFVKIEVMIHLYGVLYICRPKWCSCLFHLQLVYQLQYNKSSIYLWHIEHVDFYTARSAMFLTLSSTFLRSRRCCKISWRRSNPLSPFLNELIQCFRNSLSASSTCSLS